MKNLLLLLTTCAGLSACGSTPETQAPVEVAAKTEAITLDTVLAAKGRMLIDVRTPPEFAALHIPGSINASMTDFEALAAIIPSKETPVVVFCMAGARANQALVYLQGKGYTQVVNGETLMGLAAKVGVEVTQAGPDTSSH